MSEPSSQPARSAVALRPMRWWDVEALMPLERELFAGWAWSPETFWSELAAPNRWYVTAEMASADDVLDRSRRVVGYAGLASNGAEADVQTIAVASSVQGTGLGNRLLEALVGRAAATGATSVLLEVRADNEPAIRLYERHAFERIAVRRRYYQPGDVDAHVMRLRVLPPAPPRRS